MKVLFVLSALVIVLQEGSGMPYGLGALPPMVVRSAVFENSLGSPVTVKVTFESKAEDGRPKTESYVVDAGKSVNVEGVIDHGSWTAFDPITSFKVISASNGEKEVPISSSTGVEIHRYTIGDGAANGLEITKTLI